MLTALRIKNLAPVPDLTLELQPGFNAIYRDGDARVGQWSNSVSVMVG